MKKIEDIVKDKVSGTKLEEYNFDNAIEEVIISVKSFCNYSLSDELPEELNYTIANMVIELVGANPFGLSSSENSFTPQVSSVSIGDTKVSYGKTEDVGYHKISVDDVTLNYKSQLKKFRKLRW